MSISTYNIETITRGEGRGEKKSQKKILLAVPMRSISLALPDITASAITTATLVVMLFLALFKTK